jgi:O-antigen/teichoic acid export membrane protein
MSLATANPAPAAQVVAPPRGDSLVTGVAFMLVLNIVQRGVGFVRGLLFCRILSEAALGQFSMANSFLMLAPPLVVLGLPGSMGRYIEYYRQRGQLQAYLRKMTVVMMSLTGLGIMLMTWFARPLAVWLFDDASQMRLMLFTLSAVGLVSVFNFLSELLTAIRQVRALSWMQFVNSIVFTLAGVLLVFLWESTAEAVVLAYGISCLAALVAILPWYAEIKAEFTHDDAPLAARDAWSKLVPFAAWVWLTNLVANIADFVDRFMILHVSGLETHAAQALVGQYHSSRVVPLLIATLGSTIAAIVLPHWSHAWEAHERPRVMSQVNLAAKLIAVLFTAGSLLVVWTSPILFGWVLGGKYNSGLDALPWALVGAVWFATLIVTQTYLLCVERARLVTAACALGVVINIGLNFIAMPWGLTAILAARSISTLVIALLILLFCARHGLTCSRGLAIALVAPLVILCPPLVGTLLLLAVVLLDWKLHWLFDESEDAQLRDLAKRMVAKFKQKLLTS